jgi:nitrogenase-associated protein
MIMKFFEKPGCVGNARQKAILTTAGHKLIVENLLTYPFTKETLKAYFKEEDFPNWFNQSAPRIKSGEFDIMAVDMDQALDEMLKDHLLIRRPLLEFGEHKVAGFNIGYLETLGISCSSVPRIDLVGKSDLESCPGEKIGLKCSEPRTLPDLNI